MPLGLAQEPEPQDHGSQRRSPRRPPLVPTYIAEEPVPRRRDRIDDFAFLMLCIAVPLIGVIVVGELLMVIHFAAKYW